jgi:hypothetical protein
MDDNDDNEEFLKAKQNAVKELWFERRKNGFSIWEIEKIAHRVRNEKKSETSFGD